MTEVMGCFPKWSCFSTFTRRPTWAARASTRWRSTPKSACARSSGRERQEYRSIRDEADGYIRQRGDTPAGVGTVARVSAEWMSKGQLAMDDSRGRIAEMMIQGTTMGIVKTIRHLNDYQGQDGDARRLGERLLDMQEQNVERMKAYL